MTGIKRRNDDDGLRESSCNNFGSAGDVRSQHSGHLRDVSKSSLRQRHGGEADRVPGRIRHRQRSNRHLLCGPGVVAPARSASSDVVTEINQQRYVHLRSVLHLASGRGISRQMRRNCQTFDPFHHIHRPRRSSNRLYHMDVWNCDRRRKQRGCVRDVFQLDHLACARQTRQHGIRSLFGRDKFHRTNPDHNDRVRQGVPRRPTTGEVYVLRRASSVLI